ncbi:putative quinol monooxygenase [Streptomyces sp. URMC 123]|uniref:putative quinol monooxygenase n=1 Tax=Streptomyces sp. URMC 123 TaxID=3423403 RepID=UPI003F1D423E
MFDLIVIVRVNEPGDIGPVGGALARMRPMCLAEDGCVSWEAYHSQDDPGRFVLVERWASRAHWEAHGEGRAIQEVYVPEILPRVEREVHPSTPVSLSTPADAALSAALSAPVSGPRPPLRGAGERHHLPRSHGTS